MLLTPLALLALMSADPSAAPANSAAAASAEQTGPFAIAWLSPKVQRWAPEIRAASKRHGVDPELVAIVIAIESGGNAGAVSRMNARGLMQVLPATATAIAAERGLPTPTVSELDEAARNLDFGVYLLRSLQRALVPGGGHSGDDVALVGAGYNGGLRRVRRWQNGDAELSAETSKYMKTIKKMWSLRHSDTLE